MTSYATMPRDFKFGFTAAETDFPATLRVALSQCGVKKVPTHVEADGMRGDVVHRSEDVAEGTYTCSGPVNHTPRFNELHALLPLALGGTWNGTVLEPDIIPKAFGFAWDRKVRVFHYHDMVVASGSLSSSAGQPLRMQLQLEGCEQTVHAAGTFPSLALSNQSIIMHHTLTATVMGETRRIDQFQLSWNNVAQTDRFWNSQHRVEIPQGDRQIQISFLNPFREDEIDLYQATVAGFAFDGIWQAGGRSLRIQCPHVQAAVEDPDLTGPVTEMPLRIQGTARSKVADPITLKEIKFTLIHSV